MKYTIAKFRKDFPNDDRCLEYIFRTRFPESKKWSRVKSRLSFVNTRTSEQVFPLVGTVFQKTTTPLTLWFYAIYLFSVSKNGVSAKELERQLGVSYKTAWRMASQIRKLMEQDHDKLSGIVEIDEAYVSKKPVVGAIERGGKVKAKVSENMGGAAISAHVVRSVESGTKLMSDSSKSYQWLDRHYEREAVNHSKEYARGAIHINSMEAFWAQVKRSIHGTHHSVSPKHLQSYLDFFSFQHSYRTSSVPLFLVLLARACQSLGAKA